MTRKTRIITLIVFAIFFGIPALTLSGAWFMFHSYRQSEFITDADFSAWDQKYRPLLDLEGEPDAEFKKAESEILPLIHPPSKEIEVIFSPISPLEGTPTEQKQKAEIFSRNFGSKSGMIAKDLPRLEKLFSKQRDLHLDLRNTFCYRPSHPSRCHSEASHFDFKNPKVLMAAYVLISKDRKKLDLFLADLASLVHFWAKKESTLTGSMKAIALAQGTASLASALCYLTQDSGLRNSLANYLSRLDSLDPNSILESLEFEFYSSNQLALELLQNLDQDEGNIFGPYFPKSSLPGKAETLASKLLVKTGLFAYLTSWKTSWELDKVYISEVKKDFEAIVSNLETAETAQRGKTYLSKVCPEETLGNQMATFQGKVSKSMFCIARPIYTKFAEKWGQGLARIHVQASQWKDHSSVSR